MRSVVDRVLANRWLQLLALVIALSPLAAFVVSQLADDGAASNGVFAYDPSWDDLGEFASIDTAEASGIAYSAILENAGDVPVEVANLDARLLGNDFDVTFAAPGNCEGGSFVLPPGRHVPVEVFIHQVLSSHLAEAAHEGVGFDLSILEVGGTRRPVVSHVTPEDLKSSTLLLDIEAECRGAFLK